LSENDRTPPYKTVLLCSIREDFFVTRPANTPLIFMLFYDPIGTSWEGLEGITEFKV
jgi:hypothetical protein